MNLLYKIRTVRDLCIEGIMMPMRHYIRTKYKYLINIFNFTVEIIYA